MAFLSLRNISLTRGPKAILSDVDWQVERGQHHAVIGANGCGKTTLLSIITGYLWPTTGSVEVFDQRFGSVDLHELRKRIGWVTGTLREQVTQSRPFETVVDVVLSGRNASIGLYESITDDDTAKALDLLRRFDCTALEREAFATLSQGEKQRVLLARAWMADPDLLILDEPCTGLDLFARERLLFAIDSLAKADRGPTLLYVTHHVEELVPSIKNALLLKNGSVLSQGEVRDVLTSQHLTDAFSVQVDVLWDEHGRCQSHVAQGFDTITD